MHQHHAQVVGAVGRLLQVHHAADDHLSGQHRVARLELCLPLHHLYPGDDPGGGGNHVGRGGLVHNLRGRVLFPDDDLRPGAVKINRQKGQLRQGQQHLMAHHPLVDGRAVHPHLHPAALQLSQNHRGGYPLVAGHLDDQPKAGKDADRGQTEGKPRQKGIPPAKAQQEKGQPQPALKGQIAHGPLGNLLQLAQVLFCHAHAQGVGVHPFQLPEGHRALGAEIQKPLGKGAHNPDAHRPPQKVNHGLHHIPPMSAPRCRYAR
ncbi:hypothetical protein SDC9_126877 [bioreactor metagenome]|uniref:Uncharacterized protein n=1 Tax=bioreactor metagenome TaxID=1076179 RepID=A0A645CSG9_9ZZZZ